MSRQPVLCHVRKQIMLKRDLELTRNHLQRVNEALTDYERLQQLKASLKRKAWL